MANPVIHWELGCKDADKMHAFLEGEFGWKIDKSEELNYHGVTAVGEHGITGGIHDQLDGQDPYLTFYVMVDDPQKFLDKAKSLGAQTAMEPMEVPTVGTIAVFTEPTNGHRVGLFKPGDPNEPAPRTPGDNPVVHWEVATKDPAALQNFFEQLFGWEFETMENLNYRIAKAGDTFGIGGGILQTTEEIPPYVTIYTYVNDLDQYTNKASTLGGTVIVPPMEISSEVGSMSIISGPDDPNPLGLFKGANE